MSSKWLNRAVVAVVLVAASPLAAPQLLAFPYAAKIGSHRVYAETPIDGRLTQLVAKADRTAAASALGHARKLDQPIFLTNGGWRWSWLAAQYSGAFAFSRAVGDSIILNRSDVAHDVVENGASIGGRRSLDGTLAHEMTHGLIRAHFGVAADLRYPAELREGYCDYVAGGGSLSDAEAQKLIRQGRTGGSVLYWSGRKKVAAALAANHGNVDALFANWRG